MKANKKKSKLSRRQKMGKGTRLKDAAEWIKEYEGRVLVQKYKKRYGLDSVVKAVDELLSLGAKLDSEYVGRIKKSVENNISYVMRKRESKLAERDEGKLLMTTKPSSDEADLSQTTKPSSDEDDTSAE